MAKDSYALSASSSLGIIYVVARWDLPSFWCGKKCVALGSDGMMITSHRRQFSRQCYLHGACSGQFAISGRVLRWFRALTA